MLRSLPMPLWLPSNFFSDARHYQIAALSTLLIFNIGWLDFGARPLNSALAIGAALITQALCSRWFGVPMDPRSPLITGLSLSLLLRADEAWLHALAGAIGIGSKFLLRIDGKHIWNPAGLAIVILLFTSNDVWISPGSWGTAVWLVTLLCFFAILVLMPRAARTWRCSSSAAAALLLLRACWLGIRSPFSTSSERLAAVLFLQIPIHGPRRIRDSAASSSRSRSLFSATTWPSSCRCGQRFTSR
jgi:hypothetical protein